MEDNHRALLRILCPRASTCRRRSSARRPSWWPSGSRSTSGASNLLLSSGLGVQGMLWATSPACTELETLVLDWLVEMLDLPKIFLSTGKGGGVIQDTASSAAVCALLAGRERATNYASNEEGIGGTKL